MGNFNFHETWNSRENILSIQAKRQLHHRQPLLPADVAKSMHAKNDQDKPLLLHAIPT